MSDHFTNSVTAALRDHAMTLPEVSEGTSCVNRAFRVRNKNFLFVGEKQDGACKVMLRLGASLGEAAELARGDSRFEVGRNGWATIRFDSSNPPEAALLGRWVDESYRLLAPKSLVTQL